MYEPSPNDTRQAARQFAWDHFDLHASHRIEMFKSYVAFIAVVYAAYGVSLQQKVYFIGMTLSALGAFLSLIFLFLDERIRILIKISERYLLDDEKALSIELKNPKIRLFRKSDLITHFGGRPIKATYSNLFRSVYYGNIAISCILFLASLAILTAS